MTKRELGGCSEDVKEKVLLPLCYFDRKEDVMSCCVEEMSLEGEVEMDQGTPILITFYRSNCERLLYSCITVCLKELYCFGLKHTAVDSDGFEKVIHAPVTPLKDIYQTCWN